MKSVFIFSMHYNLNLISMILELSKESFTVIAYFNHLFATPFPNQAHELVAHCFLINSMYIDVKLKEYMK